MGYLDVVNVNDRIVDSLGHYYPDYEFTQVASSLSSVEVVSKERTVTSVKTFLGITYGKTFEEKINTHQVYFTHELKWYPRFFREEIIIHYGICNITETVFWKLNENIKY